MGRGVLSDRRMKQCALPFALQGIAAVALGLAHLADGGAGRAFTILGMAVFAIGFVAARAARAVVFALARSYG